VQISEIASFIGSKEVSLKKDATISDFSPLLKAGSGHLTFSIVPGKRGATLLQQSRASLIICHINTKRLVRESTASLIFVDNPRLWFIRVVKRYTRPSHSTGISPHAIVKSNTIGRNVSIGPFSYVGENVTIGDNTTISGGVHIHPDVSIGREVTIDSCAVIGTDGFGFERNEKKQLEKFPHIGRVIIEDNVEVGANVCIDKGTIEDTVVGFGSKIDNLVHIAHNVRIGANCMIVAQSLLGGSCILEDNVFVGAGSTVRDGGILIGHDAFIGMGAVVTKNVSHNTTVVGVPAKPMKNMHRRKK
jgi:UDP-3-O-[3-hydroxymyristoyl] glucosamine N-acyltransferase